MKLMEKKIYVTRIDGNDLIVERGKDGTPIASHLKEILFKSITSF